jgi:hypothetical protein
MRALGPGSVSSLLQTILDVVFAALAAGAGAAALLTIASIAIAADPAMIDPAIAAEIRAQGLAGVGLPLELGYVAFYVTGVLVMVGRLRRICATLTAGDPFHPDNVRRLRAVGLILAGLELSRVPFAAVMALAGTHGAGGWRLINPTAWFAVLVVFVLAEVFREGARLRREAELTI